MTVWWKWTWSSRVRVQKGGKAAPARPNERAVTSTIDHRSCNLLNTTAFPNWDLFRWSVWLCQKQSSSGVVLWQNMWWCFASGAWNMLNRVFPGFSELFQAVIGMNELCKFLFAHTSDWCGCIRHGLSVADVFCGWRFPLLINCTSSENGRQYSRKLRSHYDFVYFTLSNDVFSSFLFLRYSIFIF